MRCGIALPRPEQSGLDYLGDECNLVPANLEKVERLEDGREPCMGSA